MNKLYPFLTINIKNNQHNLQYYSSQPVRSHYGMVLCLLNFSL